MEYRNARALTAALRARQVSALELTDQAIAAIEAGDGALNAVVVRDFDRAREAARAADAALSQRRARGEADDGARPLLGLPMTVKEAFNVAGLPTTWGLPGTAGIPIIEDAVAVQRLKAAGAVILGKTNVATMLGDWQSANPVYGATSNPWDLSRTSGGSSGGGAAAVAAGFVSLEFGSDLSSSLRAPAAFCGVYAHKPSHGIVPQRGFAPPGVPAVAMPAIDLSVLGPMARSPGDLAMALDATAGADEREGAAWRLHLPPPRHAALRDFRVLVLDEHPLLPTSAEIKAALAALAAGLEAHGCRVARSVQALPDLEAMATTQVELMMAQFSADTPDEAYAGALAAAASVAGRTDIATANLRGIAMSHRDWIRADRRRFDLINAWRRLFENWDVVICPAMPTTAFAHDASPMDQRTLDVDGKVIPYVSQPLWGTLANLTGNPATAFPLGLGAGGLPMGGQIVGPYLEDRTTLAFAAHLEAVFGGFTPPF